MQKEEIDALNVQLDQASLQVIEYKATEPPFSGEYTRRFDAGFYLCRRCGTALYRSESKFHSQCGWPAFDQSIKDRVESIPDEDGVRTEIRCGNCSGHLGHVFLGEQFTPLNTRHCVNSLSLRFLPMDKCRTACFAAGCFWGVEHWFTAAPGVVDTVVGYTGGKRENPGYAEVKSGQTGHYEAIEVTYDPEKTDYAALARIFFEIHDPGQTDGQGPDLGSQYLSAVFTDDPEEIRIIGRLAEYLRSQGQSVATKVLPKARFWPAEEYHQEYYQKNGEQPYCHIRTTKFPESLP